MKQETTHKDTLGAFMHTVGHETFIIRVLVWVVTLLFAALLVVSGAVAVQSNRLTNLEPLVVYVDRDTGITETREFAVVDAANQERGDREIWIFVNDFLRNVYDFTRYSQVRNLEQAYLLCDSAVQHKLKEYFIRDGRPSRVRSDVIGLCDVESVFILDTLPDLRVRVVFGRKVLRSAGTPVLDKKIEAVLRVKTVVRGRHNPHGLYITDYRETVLKEQKGETS